MSGTLSKGETIFWGVLLAIFLGALVAIGVRNMSMSDREYQLRCTIGTSSSMNSEWGSSFPYLDDGAAWSLPDGGFYRMKEGEACKPVYRTPSR
jgi:hypothetical protein